jgi:hypothetical protein
MAIPGSSSLRLRYPIRRRNSPERNPPGRHHLRQYAKGQIRPSEHTRPQSRLASNTSILARNQRQTSTYRQPCRSNREGYKPAPGHASCQARSRRRRRHKGRYSSRTSSQAHSPYQTCRPSLAQNQKPIELRLVASTSSWLVPSLAVSATAYLMPLVVWDRMIAAVERPMRTIGPTPDALIIKAPG